MARRYWLFKSEPETWSWDQQVAKGKAGEPWTGVRNHTAKLNLKAMAKGDRGFFYHSVAERRIAGTVEVIRTAYPDPGAEPGAPWVCVDVVALKAFKASVTLDTVKADPRLSGMALVRFSRLSVQPVTEDEWRIVCGLGGIAP
jgi:predicted RNA-binding protein with PUA-like domain